MHPKARKAIKRMQDLARKCRDEAKQARSKRLREAAMLARTAIIDCMELVAQEFQAKR
jgi:hypothetical protein